MYSYLQSLSSGGIRTVLMKLWIGSKMYRRLSTLEPVWSGDFETLALLDLAAQKHTNTRFWWWWCHTAYSRSVVIHGLLISDLRYSDGLYVLYCTVHHQPCMSSARLSSYPYSHETTAWLSCKYSDSSILCTTWSTTQTYKLHSNAMIPDWNLRGRESGGWKMQVCTYRKSVKTYYARSTDSE